MFNSNNNNFCIQFSIFGFLIMSFIFLSDALWLLPQRRYLCQLFIYSIRWYDTSTIFLFFFCFLLFIRIISVKLNWLSWTHSKIQIFLNANVLKHRTCKKLACILFKSFDYFIFSSFSVTFTEFMFFPSFSNNILLFSQNTMATLKGEYKVTYPQAKIYVEKWPK